MWNAIVLRDSTSHTIYQLSVHVMAWKQYALNYDPLIAKSRSTFYSQQCPYDGLVNLFEKAKKEENVGNAFDQI